MTTGDTYSCRLSKTCQWKRKTRNSRAKQDLSLEAKNARFTCKTRLVTRSKKREIHVQHNRLCSRSLFVELAPPAVTRDWGQLNRLYCASNMAHSEFICDFIVLLKWRRINDRGSDLTFFFQVHGILFSWKNVYIAIAENSSIVQSFLESILIFSFYL